MELVHLISKNELKRALDQEGFWKETKEGTLFSSVNGWKYSPQKREIGDDDVFLTVSSEDTALELEPIWDKKGRQFYAARKPVYPSSILGLADPKKRERTCILMNTSMIDEKWCYPAIKPFLHKDDHVCVVALSFYNDTQNKSDWDRQYKKGQGIWYRANTDVFFKYGIRPENIQWISYFEDSVLDMQNKIMNSNVVLFTGGAPDLMYRRIREKKLVRLLKDYQGVVLGYSAGAMIQTERYHITPDEDYPEFSWNPGLGYVPFLDVEVHYKNSRIQRESIERALQEGKKPVYALYEDGGIIVNNPQKVQMFGRAELFEVPAES